MNEDTKDGLYKQQTAVEWLVSQLEGEESLVARIVGLKEYNQIVKQAKEMEKEQIVNADLNATKRTAKGVNADVSIRRVKELAEQYYNKTYGGNK